MAKNKVSEWSSTPANNTDIANIDIAEGCAPSGVNNAIREVMAQVKDMQTGADGDNFTVGGNLAVTGSTTLTGSALLGNSLTVAGIITATNGVNGNLTGNVTGNCSGTALNVTGTVAVANGGTGLTTLTANNVILGNGTSTPSFVAPSTAGNVLTSNGTTWVSGTAGIGTGQTWQNVKASRTWNTDYTNTTGKPILVNVSAGSTSTNSALNAFVDGVQVSYQLITVGYSSGVCSMIVPNNSVYKVTRATGSEAIEIWAELR